MREVNGQSRVVYLSLPALFCSTGFRLFAQNVHAEPLFTSISAAGVVSRCRRVHPECLRKDKLRGVHQQRRQQNELFARWLRKQTCPKCGARCGESRSEGAAGPPREASQRPVTPEMRDR